MVVTVSEITVPLSASKVPEAEYSLKPVAPTITSVMPLFAGIVTLET